MNIYSSNSSFETKKNFILKPEMGKKIIDNQDIHPISGNMSRINPIINYYCNNIVINYNDYRFFDFKSENFINNKIITINMK